MSYSVNIKDASVTDDQELWSLLELVVSQLEKALSDASKEADIMTDRVLELSQKIGSDIPLVTNNPAMVAECVDDLVARSNNVCAHLQFVDRLQQRQDNLRRILEQIILCARNGELPAGEKEWKAFIKTIRSGYTTDEERNLHDQRYPKSKKKKASSIHEADGPLLF